MKFSKALVCVVVLLSLGLFVSCSKREDTSQKGTLSQEKKPALPVSSQKLLALLPEDNSVPGWTRAGDVKIFTPDNLFEYIDGAAESYFVYGFEEVAAAEYHNPKQKSSIVLDLYRMKDARNAFGIYRSELYPDADFKQIGVEGYLGETALNFWAGSYYVKVTVFEEGDAIRQEMMKLAGRLVKKIGEPGVLPPEAAGFPTKDQVLYSVRYLPKDVLGQTYLKEGFEAKYRKGDVESRLVMLITGDESAAKEVLAKYRTFTVSGGKVFRDVSSPGDGGFVGKDGYYGNMAAIRSGNKIVIALGGPSTDYAVSQAAACVQKK